jgi:hypothetical protein
MTILYNMPKFGPCRYSGVEILKPCKVPFYMVYRRWRLAWDGGSVGNYVNYHYISYPQTKLRPAPGWANAQNIPCHLSSRLTYAAVVVTKLLTLSAGRPFLPVPLSHLALSVFINT